jgi:hypothetical protein
MKMKTRYLWILALAVMLGGGAALADDLNVGGNYNSIPLVGNLNGSYGGGAITTSYLNGVQITLYCVDLYDTIPVPKDYNNTTTTSNGMVTELNSPLGTTGGVVNNAGQVAWLLTQYASADSGNTTAQIALQAAIWHVVYAGTAGAVDLNSSSTSYSLYTTYLGALGSNTAPLSDVDWFSPGIKGDNTVYQGLAGVPDGGVTLLLLGGALVGLETLRRRLNA